MAEAVLVEVTRGEVVESVHRGALAVLDADGAEVLVLGDIDRPVFPRSAVKIIQALPLIESGAADRFGLTEDELALACASHSGEPRHAETAARMLSRAGREPGCLECGAHWPMGQEAARALARSGGEPTALHNNCSGKHAGFVCAACAMEVDPAGYIEPGHPVQREVKAAMEALTGFAHTDELRGTDGCSIPTYAVPLRALARAFARIGTGTGLTRDRAAAFARLRAAVATHPFMVAGTGRFDTILMEALGQRAFVKVGAEGVYCATFPELGLGIALKCDDGAARAAEVAMAALVERFLPLSDVQAKTVADLARLQIRNWNGRVVGAMRPAAALAGA